MILAGLPTTMTFGGTFLVTTAPEAIMELSPMLTFGRIVAFTPIHTRLSIFTPLHSVVERFCGLKSWFIVTIFTFGAINVPSPISIPPLSIKVQQVLINTPFSRRILRQSPYSLSQEALLSEVLLS